MVAVQDEDAKYSYIQHFEHKQSKLKKKNSIKIMNNSESNREAETRMG